MSTPTIGRIVHYQAHGSPDGTHKSLPRAAVVTEAGEDGTRTHGMVKVCVLNPSGIFFSDWLHEDASEAPRGGTWRWPPKAS